MALDREYARCVRELNCVSVISGESHTDLLIIASNLCDQISDEFAQLICVQAGQ